MQYSYEGDSWCEANSKFFFLKKNVKESHLLINNFKKIIFKLFKKLFVNNCHKSTR